MSGRSARRRVSCTRGGPTATIPHGTMQKLKLAFPLLPAASVFREQANLCRPPT